MASIVDRPKASSEGDLLEIEKYTNGLIHFIESSETPITIGVQGEWGSGKTSLLNTIQKDLETNHYTIWINTWEYSLLSTPDETLIKIISGLVVQISELSKEKPSEQGKKAIKAVGTVLKEFGGFFGGAAGQIAEKAGEVLQSSMEKKHDNSIKALRDALEQVIKVTLEGNCDKRAFIFFIDDLDRLDPTVAVTILELIKNLFDLDKCIFVLAIDYGVVVKGLQSKFGKMTDENEWEFRAFFDKIIQLPFSMPTSNYSIDTYLKSLLIKVEYFSENDLNDNRLEKIVEIVNLSVGTNPRSLKRLANSIGLMENIRSSDDEINTEERVIEFALVCIQIAYPVIYRLIQKEPDFTKWSEDFVQEFHKNKNIDDADLNALISKKHKDFDEKWEQNLWKICQINSFLRQKVHSISQLLSLVKEDILSENNEKENMGEILERLLSMSSVTSFSVDSVVTKKHTRLSAKKKQKITKSLQNIINERVKNKYVNYFNHQSGFNIDLQSNKRNVWLPIKIDDVEFDLCVWTNHQSIKIYVNSKVSNEKTITWFTENMGDFYTEMRFDKSSKDGKRVVVLDEYSITNHTQAISEYENAIENTFNKFLSKVNDA